jgi:hypothetical protein
MRAYVVTDVVGGRQWVVVMVSIPPLSHPETAATTPDARPAPNEEAALTAAP